MIYSEIILVLNNENINYQVDKLKKGILKDEILSENYYMPFIIFLSRYNLDLSGFNKLKTFQYRIALQNLLYYDLLTKKKININNIIINNTELQNFLTRLHIIFSYYNELGDIFSFKNSEGEEITIRNVDDTNITDYINIMFLGRSGVGKSSLINYILDEKKSLEGGTGFSTTSKNIIIYQKQNIPLRLYDIKGIESEESIQNQINILSNDKEYPKNAIFYCLEYSGGTVIFDMEKKLFEKLVELEIPIIFVITKCIFNPYEKDKDSELNQGKKADCERIKNAITSTIRNILKAKYKSKVPEIFIAQYIRFYFINLLGKKSIKLNPFGVDKLLSFFTDAVSKEDWDKLRLACLEKDSVYCKQLLKNNLYLKSYTEFEIIRNRNKKEALEYLKYLKAGAFLTGMIPLADIGFEYLYRDKFTSKLESLYGFALEEANSFMEDEEKMDIKYYKSESELKEEKIINKNIKYEKKNIEENIDKDVNNKIRNTGAIIRVIGQVGLGIGKAAANVAVKAASCVMLPVTVLGCAIWSFANIDNDCQKILKIFDKAFTPLRFETLLAYINIYEKSIGYLEEIKQKFINSITNKY